MGLNSESDVNTSFQSQRDKLLIAIDASALSTL